MFFLDDLPRGGARRAPELQYVPAHLVGKAEDAGDDRVGGARRATTGSGAAAEDQTPQAQHVFARLSSIRGPRAARRADVSDELLTSDPVLIPSQFRPSALVDLAARAEAQAESDSRCGGCLCCCGPRPDVLVEHEAQREARIAAHRGVLPGLEPDAGEA